MCQSFAVVASNLESELFVIFKSEDFLHLGYVRLSVALIVNLFMLELSYGTYDRQTDKGTDIWSMFNIRQITGYLALKISCIFSIRIVSISGIRPDIRPNRISGPTLPLSNLI